MRQPQPATRLEHDLLGERAVPAGAYYGIHTLRALENFPITGTPISIYPEFVNALAGVKQAAALTNYELRLLDKTQTDAIVRACEDIRAGKLHDQFVVDVIQGGAGTSTNMNANEVIANRGLELMGRARGEYTYLHPLEHVNMSQSTNDVYPTAVKVALRFEIDRLRAAMATLRREFEAKAEEFNGVLKMGRTQLQDAVPMTLGQEFSTYVENSIGIVTALNPYVGYENATAIAKEAHATGQSVYELVLAKGLLTKAQLDDLLRPEILTQPRPLPERE